MIDRPYHFLVVENRAKVDVSSEIGIHRGLGPVTGQMGHGVSITTFYGTLSSADNRIVGGSLHLRLGDFVRIAQ